MEDNVLRGLDVRIEEIQEKHQQSIKEKNATIALLNDDLKNCEYKNVGLQGEIRAKDQKIAALQRCFVGYLLKTEEDKNNGISIIAKSNYESGYPYISICGQHGYRRNKVQADGDTPNSIVTYNIWREHRLIVVDPNRPRHFRLDMLNQDSLVKFSCL